MPRTEATLPVAERVPTVRLDKRKAFRIMVGRLKKTRKEDLEVDNLQQMRKGVERMGLVREKQL